MKKIILGLALFHLTFQSLFAQQPACLSDNFSAPALWTHVGTNNNVSIDNNSIFFNDAQDGSEDRVWRQVTALNTWRIDFDFNPIAHQSAGHSILDYTSNSLDPWYTGAWGTITNQDECGITYGANANIPVLNLKAKQGLVNVPNPNAGIPLPVGATYYIRFERLNGQTLSLSVFSNPARTTLIGSPIVLTIPCTLGGLGFIQSCVGWGGSPSRSLTARLSNLSICPLINNGQSTCAIQNCLLDDNSLVASWTHTGPLTNVSAQGNSVRFNASIDGSQDRVSRRVSSYNTWRATFDFRPIANTNAAHSIFCYSQFDLDPWYTLNWGTITNQDHCALTYNSNGAVPTLSMNAKQGLVQVPNTNPGIPLPLGQTYFITFERINLATLRLSVFSDAARTKPVGTPQFLVIPCTLGNLNFIQSAAGWGGSPARSLTANIDNISLCQATEDVSFNVGATPPSSSVCSGDKTAITLSSNRSYATYAWSVEYVSGTVNNATNGTGNTIAQRLTGDGKIRYHVTASSVNPCGDISTRMIDVDVTVKPLPNVSVNSGSVCGNGGSTILNATTAYAGTTFSWYPATGLNSTTGQSVVAKPTISTLYTVDALLNGCSSSAKANVTYTPFAAAITVTPPYIYITDCRNGGYGDFTASSTTPGLTYTWSPATYLNTTTGPTVRSTIPPTDYNLMEYTVTGTLNNCASSAKVSIGLNCALPVYFISSSATVTPSKQIRIDWTATNERGAVRYEIRRAANGGQAPFQTLSSITILGGSSKNNYSWTDAFPPSGSLIYVIVRIDQGGYSDYSNYMSTRAFKIGAEENNTTELSNELLISPNPSSGTFNLQSNLSGTGEITVTDALGQTVEKSVSHDLSNNFTFGEYLKKGVYVVTIVSDNGTKHFTVIKE